MGPFDLLTEQHRELEERFDAIEAEEGASEAEERREQTEELLALLRLHSSLEERHLYPLLARVEGRARAREEAEDHLTMRELMEELEEQSPGSPEWWACFTALEDLIVAHVREEEAQTFPRLLTVMDEGEQDELRRAFESLREELSAHAQVWPPANTAVSAPRWDV